MDRPDIAGTFNPLSNTNGLKIRATTPTWPVDPLRGLGYHPVMLQNTKNTGHHHPFH